MKIHFLEQKQDFDFEQIRQMQHFEDTKNGKILRFCSDYLNQTQEFIFYTSGSTGIPKAISVNRKQIQASIAATAQFFGLKKGQKALVCLNTDFVAGKMMLLRGLELGLELFVGSPSANPLENVFQEMDFAAFVPLQLQGVLEKNIEKINLLKCLILGGASVSDALLLQIQALQTPIFQTYGMTETLSHIAVRRLNPYEDFYTVLPTVQVRLNEKNCLEICGQVCNNEWIVTNDLVEIKDGKRLKFLGRADNVINSGGLKIQIEDLERQIGQIFEQIGINKRLVVVGVADSILGEKIVLAIESEKLEEEKIWEKLKNLEKYHCPKLIVYLSVFPQTQTQKIDRKALRRQIDLVI